MKAIFTLILLTIFGILAYQTCFNLAKTWSISCEKVGIEDKYDREYSYDLEPSEDDQAKLFELETEFEKATYDFLIYGFWAALALSLLCCINEPARIITCAVLSGITSLIVGIIGICIASKIWAKLDDD